MNKKIFWNYALWSVGAVLFVAFFCPMTAFASTDINASSSAHWAWNDFIGWIDLYGNGDVLVTSAGMTGEASSSAGMISFNCNGASSTPTYNFCGTSNYGVLNDGGGNLSGWAWNDEYGWISFSCSNGGTGCGTSAYHVTIDQYGNFTGYAWNDAIGWISFSCNQPNPPSNTCGTSNYGTQTTWIATSTTGILDSQTFDTGVQGGAQLNSVIWHGQIPLGTSLGFQFAVSNVSSGPWNFIGPNGVPNSTSSYWNANIPSSSVPLDYVLYNNFRYFRYRITLTSNAAETATPRVDDVIVNWSP
jgi:hypothetical protein